MKKNLEGLDCIHISIETYKDKGELVEIGFFPENKNAEDNFSGILVAYQSGKLAGYAIFDEEGLDYVAPPPYSREEEKEVIIRILKLLEGGVAKIRKN